MNNTSISNDLQVVLVGIGGYGSFYLRSMLDPVNSDNMRGVTIAGAVDPYPEKCNLLSQLETRKVPIYSSLDEFYHNHASNLAIISSPIHMHVPQTCLALSRGSYVLCEKPLCATIQDAYKLIETEKETGKSVAIGYQWSFSKAIKELKKDIMDGLYGKAKKLKTGVFWPRNRSYYNRNSWAGAMKTRDGKWVLDSPINNANAHYLHNMFYILGDKVNASARPSMVVAELYRANPIENFDTGVLRCHTDKNAEILFFSSHAVYNQVGPMFSFEFEKGIVKMDTGDSNIIGVLSDGTKKDYGSPENDPLNKVWDSIEMVKEGKSPVCGPEAASSQTLCVNGIQESAPDIVTFPQDLINVEKTSEEERIWVKGLDDVLKESYERELLPSELSVKWSRKGKEIDLTEYKKFPAECN